MKQRWSDVPLEISNPNKEKDESAGGGGRILVCGLLHLRIAQVATITLSGGVRDFFIFAIFHIWSERRKCNKDVFKLWERKSWPGLRGFRLKFSLFSHISAGAGSGPLGRRNKTLEREGGGGGGGGCQGHQNCWEGGYSLSSGNTGIPGGNLASFFIPTKVVKRGNIKLYLSKHGGP